MVRASASLSKAEIRQFCDARQLNLYCAQHDTSLSSSDSLASGAFRIDLYGVSGLMSYGTDWYGSGGQAATDRGALSYVLGRRGKYIEDDRISGGREARLGRLKKPRALDRRHRGDVSEGGHETLFGDSDHPGLASLDDDGSSTRELYNRGRRWASRHSDPRSLSTYMVL